MAEATSIDELQTDQYSPRRYSFIGPRPFDGYLPIYSTFQARRHEVMPGLSGLHN